MRTPSIFIRDLKRADSVFSTEFRDLFGNRMAEVYTILRVSRPFMIGLSTSTKTLKSLIAIASFLFIDIVSYHPYPCQSCLSNSIINDIDTTPVSQAVDFLNKVFFGIQNDFICTTSLCFCRFLLGACCAIT